MNILLVEHDRPLRILLERALSAKGHTVVSSEDAGQALASLSSASPEMAIVDWTLPGEAAADFTDRVKGGRWTGTPPYLIAMVPSFDRDATLRLLERGVDDVVLKPVDWDVLESRVKIGEWIIRPLEGECDARAGGGCDPLAVFAREHEYVDSMMTVLDAVADDLDKGVPDYVLSWAMSTALLLNIEVHEDKEARYISAFVDKVTESQGEQFSELAQSVFTQITDEHRLIEERVRALQFGVEAYLGQNREALDDYNATNNCATALTASEVEETARRARLSAEEFATKRREASSALKGCIRRYVDLLRPHMNMEERAFFPLTQKYLDPSDNERIMGEFKKIDERLGREEVERHIAEVIRLADVIKKGSSPQRAG